MTYKYDIDIQNGTSHLDLFVSGDFVTAYHYENFNVTLSERPGTDIVPLAETILNVVMIGQWINELRLKFNPPLVVRAEFTDEVEKKNNKLTGKYSFGNSQFGKVTFDNNTKEFEFKPRPEVTMNFDDFKGWYDFLNRLIIAAQRFE